MFIVTSLAVCRNKVDVVKLLVAFLTSALNLSWAPVWAGASKHFMNTELEIWMEYLGLLYHIGVVTFLRDWICSSSSLLVCRRANRKRESER